ncbi:hypothetical protein Agub_g11781 [Astrephomene gubernaculifera]|uniref:Tetratricopeptide repeat protein 1 n=1 Tax=Astrephomene gubernaculifera TaxID=47775 RepID=A0AAD3DXF9_9CHLO|nr:hypothetical protein Agub_g11781 [Astrephomene gubernaculifera]
MVVGEVEGACELREPGGPSDGHATRQFDDGASCTTGTVPESANPTIVPQPQPEQQPQVQLHKQQQQQPAEESEPASVRSGAEQAETLHPPQQGGRGDGQQQQQQQPEQQQEEGQQAEQGGEVNAANEEDAAERAARAEALKREGNELFGRGEWDAAAAKYNEALDAAPAAALKERAIYFANLAACNIKTQQYAAAVQSCTEALQLDPSYKKAYMRRCEAFERLDELDHALSDAKKLLELAPDSSWAKSKVAALQPVVDERTEKLKTEMLSKLKDLGNTILGKFGLSTDNFKFDKDPNTGSYNIRFER